MTLRLYNTLTRQLEAFRPLKPPQVTMYVCGPTVYDDPHIGHVRSAYVFEVLRRYLAYRGYQIRFVRNVTDVDDKIIEKARGELGSRVKGQGSRELHIKCQEISERYLKSYHETLAKLGLTPPTEEPRAMQHIPEMQAMIRELLQRGEAYQAGGDVYFSVRKFAAYGKLSNRSLDDLQAGARVEPGEHKRDPLDFALWKAAKPEEPAWDSPWGKGRPGWHIECSVMSTQYLGDQFDIHGGGVDLVFPHHENEIAQAQAAGKPFARWWVHNGLVTINGQKMAKSLGNFVTADEVSARYDADVLKLFFLGTHYRGPADFSWKKLDEMKSSFSNFDRFFQKMRQFQSSTEPPFLEEHMHVVKDYRDEFIKAMDDDLNTPMVLAVLFDLVDQGNNYLEKNLIGATQVYQLLLELGRKIFDLFSKLKGYEHVLTDDAQKRLSELSKEYPEAVSTVTVNSVTSYTSQQCVELFIQYRDSLRKSGQYQKADEVRTKLKELGIILEDGPTKTTWWVKS